MNRIQFTEDWDKLAQPRFTTIRSYERAKEEYYRSQVGKTMLVWRKTGRSIWNGHKIGTATLRSVCVVRPADLPYSNRKTATLRIEIGVRSARRWWLGPLFSFSIDAFKRRQE